MIDEKAKMTVYRHNKDGTTWLTVEKVAVYLGVSKDTIYARLKNKNIPAYKIGRIWRFDKEEIDAWIISGKASKGKK